MNRLVRITMWDWDRIVFIKYDGDKDDINE